MAATIQRKDKNKIDTPHSINIHILPTHRRSSDIALWKQALLSFESITNPNRVLFYDLLEDIILDGQIEAVYSKRADALLNTPLFFSSDGKENEQLNRLLSCPDMLSLIRDIHASLFYGFSLIQIKDIHFNASMEQFNIIYDLIPRKHVHPEKDFQCISIEQSSCAKDFLYTQPPLSDYMIFAGSPTDKGLFFKAAQYVIYKRGAFGDWAQFTECFGMPFREMTYDEFDEATRIKMEALLKDWGAFGYMLHPKGSELTLHQASNASNAPFFDLIQACDASISKTILGNTLTTEQGSIGSQALGSVHLQVEEQKYLFDRSFVLSILNTQFKPILSRFGFNVKGGNIYFENPPKDINRLLTKWQIIQGISMRTPISDDYIYEEFDIPKPDNYEQLKKQLETINQLPADSNLSFPLTPGLDFFV